MLHWALNIFRSTAAALPQLSKSVRAIVFLLSVPSSAGQCQLWDWKPRRCGNAQTAAGLLLPAQRQGGHWTLQTGSRSAHVLNKTVCSHCHVPTVSPPPTCDTNWIFCTEMNSKKNQCSRCMFVILRQLLLLSYLFPCSVFFSKWGWG